MNSEEKRTDKRKLDSRKKIKEAFISLHAREGYDAVTVSGVCNEAGISRGTFYAHFKNVTEVLDQILDEALEGTGKFWARYLNIDPQDVADECRMPFCVFVRESKTYQKIFTDDAFFSRIVDKLVDRSFDKYYAFISENSSLSESELRALLGFQTSGCLSITKMGIREGKDEWNCIRKCIDGFVKRGIKGLVEPRGK